MRRHAAAALSLLIAVTSITILPLAGAGDIEIAGPSAQLAEVSVFKGGNGYYYVFYVLGSLGLRYAYSDNPAEGSWAYGIITTDPVSGFNVGYFGGSTVIIIYITNNVVKVAKCTVATPLSCTTTLSVTKQSATSPKVAYQPNAGRYYIAYSWYNSGGSVYLLDIWSSTTGDSWTIHYTDIMDPSTGRYYPIVTGIAALPDTSTKVIAVAGKIDTYNYWYCRGDSSSGFCAQVWTSIGSKSSDGTSDVVAVPRGTSGAEVFATTAGSTRWFSFTGSTAVDRGSFGASPVRPAIVGNTIDLYWVSGNTIYRRTADASAGTLGNAVAWYTVSGLQAVSVERFPSSLSSAAIVYQANGYIYFRYATQTSTQSISESVSVTGPIQKTRKTAQTLSDNLNAIDTAAASLGFAVQILDTLAANDAASHIINRVIEIIENTGASEFFAGLPNYLLPEIVTVLDTIASSVFTAPSGGGGGGGGGGGFVPPPTTPEQPPPDIPAAQVAWGSVVGVSVMLGVLAIGLLRGRSSPVALWRRKSSRKPLKRRRTWRVENVFK